MQLGLDVDVYKKNYVTVSNVLVTK